MRTWSYRPLRFLIFLSAALGTSCGPEEALDLGPVDHVAQPLTEGAALASYNASCLQLRDKNTWSTYAANLSGVGTVRSLSTILGDLNRQGVVLTASTRPFAPGAPVGYKGGFRWNDGDMGVAEWIPQGMTAGVVGSSNVVMVAWHYEIPSGETVDKGVRVSIADVSDLSGTYANYRHVLLVEPTTAGNFVTVKVHAGGLAWVGNYLYMVDTNGGIRVFDLTQIREVSTATACDTAIGKNGSVHCAYNYKYVLPQVSVYSVPSARSDGTAISASCAPKFSFLGKDTRQATEVLLSGEYCNPDTMTCDLDGSTPGLGGRLYRWPIDAATSRLRTSGGYVSVEKAYFMNERNIQGVAPVMVKRTDGTYPPDTYWLSASRYSGALFKVSATAGATVYRADQGDWPWFPEGMHATASGTNLWVASEGNGSTDPRNGGRVVVYVEQSSVD